MKKSFTGLKTFSTIAMIACAHAGYAQGDWEEYFDHNNPALYTNLNGGPDNLTIEDGVASFSGVEGTYYGRTDLLLPVLQPGWPLQGLFMKFLLGGPVGVGWYSPSQNAGVSAVFEMDTLTVSLFEHQGWGAPTLLASGPLGQIERYDFLFYWDEVIGGQPYVSGNTTVLHTEDMHFFMYGWASAAGPGRLDQVIAAAAPEPSTFVVLGGLALLAFARRRPTKS
jgi:hypothetical protein